MDTCYLIKDVEYLFFFYIDGTIVGQTCTSGLDTCAQNNARCNGTICDCVEGFTYNGTACGILSLFLILHALNDILGPYVILI